MHHFKVVTYLKMGCPLSTEEVPLIMGNNAPYPQCHQWVQAAMAKLVADHPDYVFTTSTRPWNIKPGDVMPATYVGIWQTFADNNIPVLAMRDTLGWSRTANRSSCGLPGQRRQSAVVWDRAVQGAGRSESNPRLRCAVPAA